MAAAAGYFVVLHELGYLPFPQTGGLEAIRDTWHSKGVILIRGQSLDEAAQVKFAQRFGELGKGLHAREGRTSLPGVMYISNLRENGKLIGALPDGEMYFHSDQCYIENPSVGTMLSRWKSFKGRRDGLRQHVRGV